LDLYLASEYVSVSITLIFLSLAAIFDFRTREVPDKIWLAYGPIGLILTTYRISVEPALSLFTAESVSLSILIAFGLVFFGLSGGADAKALICLGITLPLPPGIVTPILGFAYPFFPIVVFVTGYVISFSVVVWILVRNLVALTRHGSGMFEGLEREPMWKKVLAFITGFQTAFSHLQSTFYLYPMEEVMEDANGARRTFQVYSNANVDREQVISQLRESLKKVDFPDIVWVTPGLPLLVFMVVAVVIALTVGDPVFAGILSIVR
jgi:prepilin signal peptidase PulO-like enzyme (type II secretory pathway)